MASVGAQPSGKWGRRSFDTPINLVPYIDLMTTIITFLMMTAIWMQMSALEIQNSTGNAEVVEDKDMPKPISVMITDQGFVIHEEGSNRQALPKTEAGYDLKALHDWLKQLKDAQPQRFEVKLNAVDGIKYENIVKVIDLATGLGLTGITLKPATG